MYIPTEAVACAVALVMGLLAMLVMQDKQYRRVLRNYIEAVTSWEDTVNSLGLALRDWNAAVARLEVAEPEVERLTGEVARLERQAQPRVTVQGPWEAHG